VLTQKEPIPEPALEVVERGVAHQVAVLAVLQWAVGPTGAIEGVVVHGNNVHERGSKLSSKECDGNLYPAEQAKHPQTCKQKTSGDWITRTMSRDPTYPDIP
jgi:hypothetical protein